MTWVCQNLHEYDTKIIWNKNICPWKNDLKKEKQPTESKNKFANHMPDRRLMSRIYKELLQLNKSVNNQIF